MVREDEHADVGVPPTDLACRLEPFVAVRRWHADIDDRDVRLPRVDSAQQRRSIATTPDDIDVRVSQQAGQSLAHEALVVGDHYAHGSSARNRPCPLTASLASLPPSAPIRSWSPTSASRPTA